VRFWAKVWRPNLDDCWIWEGAVNPQGYGTFRLPGDKFCNAHRFVMMLAVGRELERSEVVDHVCRVKACVNPLHLDLVTQGENTRRGYEADPGLTW